MTLKSRCGSISGDSEVAAPPSNAAPRLSNAFAFLSTRSKTKNFWRLRRRTTHRQTEYQRSIIQSKETERKLEYYPSTKPGQVQTHASAQTFYFDREGFLRRLDYPAAHDDHTQIAQMFSGHQRFSGILIPTLCRLLSIGAEGVPVAKPSLLDVEIFDAQFE